MSINERLSQVIICLISALTFSACSNYNPVQTTQIDISKLNSSKIIAGVAVTDTDDSSKSTVGIYSAHALNSGGMICTGTLLPGNLVLTAAHCVARYITVAFTKNFDKTEKNQIFPVNKVVISDYWESRRNAEKDHGDIALLHFIGNVPEGYRPAQLLPNKELLFNGAVVTLAGFGVNKVEETPVTVDSYPGLVESVESGKVVCDDPKNLHNCFKVNMKGSGELRQTQVPISDIKYAHSEILVDQTSGTGACHGDSGGPGYIMINGTHYLWGVTSRGALDPKNNCSKFGVYTSVLFYEDWIKQSIAKMNEVQPAK